MANNETLKAVALFAVAGIIALTTILSVVSYELNNPCVQYKTTCEELVDSTLVFTGIWIYQDVYEEVSCELPHDRETVSCIARG